MSDVAYFFIYMIRLLVVLPSSGESLIIKSSLSLNGPFTSRYDVVAVKRGAVTGNCVTTQILSWKKFDAPVVAIDL